MSQHQELRVLIEVADKAYRRVRTLITDPLGHIDQDADKLTLGQRLALNDLGRAEAALERYRADIYAAQHVQVPRQPS